MNNIRFNSSGNDDPFVDGGCWINGDGSGFGHGSPGGGGIFGNIGGLGCGLNYNGGGKGLVFDDVGNNGIGRGRTKHSNEDSGAGE